MKKIILKSSYLFFLLLLSAMISCSGGGGGEGITYHYNTPEEIEIFLDEVKLHYPSITSIETVGYSESGRVIKALIISDNPGTLEGEPAVRLTGGIHGSEMMGVELLVRFIEYLTSNYGKNTTVTNMVNSRYICIIPVLNPDGLARKRRYNDNDIDLNRNFDQPLALMESEAYGLVDFSSSRCFCLSITYHVGAVLVNMPFDYGRESLGIFPVENDLVKTFAKTYTNAGTFLSNPDLYMSPYMNEGTINGGDWYVITGSLQDWSYTQTGCLDLTIEVAKRNPDTEEGVQQVFLFNRDSIMAYIDKACDGIYGRVTDGTNPIQDVEVTISGGDLVIKTDSNGYYNRILLPGTYDITFSKSGYATSTVNSITVSDRTQLDIQL